MKRLIFCILILFLNPLRQNNIYCGVLNSIYTSDGINIIAVGDSGLIMSSTNSGTSWQETHATINNLNSIFIIAEQNWIAGDSGKIYRYINSSFVELYNFGLNFSIHSLYFINNQRGYVCGSNGNIFLTVNGGQNWIQANNGIDNTNLNSIIFLNEMTGYAVGNSGKIFVTTDGGNLWNKETSATPKNLLRVKLVNDKPIVSGEEGTLLIKINNTWTHIDLKTKSDVNGISIDNSEIIHICGGGGFIRNDISNGNLNFLNFEVNPSLTGLSDIFYNDFNTGWAINSENKAIIKTTNGGENWFFSQNVSVNYFWENKISNQPDGFGNTLALHPNDGNTIFVLFKNNVFISRDKGESWNLISTINFNIGRSASFVVSPVDTNIWMAAVFVPYDCPVIRTTDYGNTWNIVLDSVTIGSYTKPLEINQDNPEIIYYATNDRGFFSSTNNGETFSRLGNTLFRNPCDVITQYGNPENILIADAAYPSIDSSYILKSTNGGTDWEVKYKVGINEIPTITNTIFYPQDAYFAANKLYKSTNFGDNWSIITSDHQPLWALDVCREDPSCIFTAKFSSIGYSTTNSGISFSSINHPSSSLFFASVLYPQRDYAIGMFHNSLYKLKWRYNVSVGIQGNLNAVVSDFNLNQNYPNPFNPVTEIKFDIKYYGNVKLVVFDAIGREVETLVKEKLQKGSYSVSFDGNNLASGIYFYTLESNSYKETRKMILLR